MEVQVLSPTQAKPQVSGLGFLVWSTALGCCQVSRSPSLRIQTQLARTITHLSTRIRSLENPRKATPWRVGGVVDLWEGFRIRRPGTPPGIVAGVGGQARAKLCTSVCHSYAMALRVRHCWQLRMTAPELVVCQWVHAPTRNAFRTTRNPATSANSIRPNATSTDPPLRRTCITPTIDPPPHSKK